jgi:hypothetical protein
MRFSTARAWSRGLAILALGVVYASSRGSTAPHMDHEPKHGGVFFMAPDMTHHLEGVLLPDGTFKVYLFDEYTRPIPGTPFAGWMQVDAPGEERKVELVHDARDGTLSAGKLPVSRFPVDLTVWITFPGRPGQPSRTDLFSFSFERFSPAEKN